MENKPITSEELQAIETEVAKKQAEALKATAEKTATEVEEKVRKEMESKIESDRLRSELQKQQEAIKKLQEDQDNRLKAQQEVFEKRLIELESQRKGLTSNQSPFDKPNPNLKMINGQEVDTEKLDLTEVEKLSAEAFKNKFRLPDFYFEKTGQVKRN
jgi:regulator of protease activity HflC (stomatin/prohibitin superfamily)